METQEEKYLFESMPIPKAVTTLAIPTIISQVVTMIYNLADTFFIGQIGNPAMVAAVSLVSPWFNLLTALGNLFGLGGGSLISRMLGCKNLNDIKHVAVFSVWGGAAATLVFSAATCAARVPLLTFLGASPDTYGYAESYLMWVVVLGGVPTMVSLTMGYLLRSEGHARQASMGMMFGGVLNVILDPLLIFGFHMDVTGAAVATAASNGASVVFFALQYWRLGEKTLVSLRPRYFTFRFSRQVFSVGLASALATAMGKGVQSASLTFSRQGLLNIPLLLLMNWIFGLYGMIWTQLAVEVIMLPVSLAMYAHTLKRLPVDERKQI